MQPGAHRSSRRVVSAASALIGHNPDRLPKQLRSGLSGEKVEIWACPDGESEADAIASEGTDPDEWCRKNNLL